MARARDWDDRIDWLIGKGQLEEALAQAQCHRAALRTHNVADVAELRIGNLLQQGDTLCPAPVHATAHGVSATPLLNSRPRSPPKLCPRSPPEPSPRLHTPSLLPGVHHSRAPRGCCSCLCRASRHVGRPVDTVAACILLIRRADLLGPARAHLSPSGTHAPLPHALPSTTEPVATYVRPRLAAIAVAAGGLRRGAHCRHQDGIGQ